MVDQVEKYILAMNMNDFILYESFKSIFLNIYNVGMTSNGNQWKQKLFIVFIIMVCSIPLVQCFAGPDVLKWRSFYATKDDVWKAHYHEVFDHGIREALCCLGRVEYL